MLAPGLRQQLITHIRRISSPIEPLSGPVDAHLVPLPGVRCVAFDLYGTVFTSAAGEIAVHEAPAPTPADGDEGPPGDRTAPGPAVDPFHVVARSLNRDSSLGATLSELFHRTIAEVHGRIRAQRNVDRPEVDIREVWSTVLRAVGAPDDDGTVVWTAVLYETAANPAWPMPGALETIHALRGRNLRVAIVSNAQFYTPLVWEAFFHHPPEDLGVTPCVYSYRHGVAKPSRELFDVLTADMSREGITPGQTLYVGNDMLNDVAGAAAAGYRTALFAGDRRSVRLRRGDVRVNGVRPDVILTELSQLVDVTA